MAQTVIGIFNSYANAQEAVQKLSGIGISSADIDVSSSGADTASGSGSSSMTSNVDATGTEGGGIGHFFKSLFSDDDETSGRYATVAQRSGTIVTVHAKTSEEAENAADILDDCGAVNVDESASSYGYTGTASSTLDTSDTATKIPIIEETLEVGKREVQTGGVRLRSRIVERPVEESLRLRQETVNVNRTSVNRAATSEDFANFSEKQIEMTETAEVPVVSKTARVVEEVSLGKDVNEKTETISDTVRKTEVDVEDLATSGINKNKI